MKANRKAIIITLIAAMVVACGVFAYLKSTANKSEHQQAAIRQAVLDSAVQCCSIEGNYPQNLKYLIDNYGLQIDERKFIVTYEPLGSNILPQVEVLIKGE